MRKEAARALLRQVQQDPGPPPSALWSEAAYKQWITTLSDEALMREQLRVMSDDELLAGLDQARREEQQEDPQEEQ